ncbi:MAG TPA: methyltransferase domain-containing protein [Promineifilum sp.]|nr:methyltransferase domain-containing protein [Promineifilum sp.]
MTKRRSLRQLAKRTIPKPLLVNSWATYCRMKARPARRVFEAAGESPAWLGLEELDQLQRAYPVEPMVYQYDLDSLAARGRERARAMLDLIRRQPDQPRRWLDLGMWDGMTCRTLQEMGRSAMGIDIRVEGLDQRAIDSGAGFAAMDAERLGFVDESFDFVFSFNSFEHFPNPEQVLREALRALRPGGYFYLDFGPVWLSPRGAHQFQTISVPYVECLFAKETLTAYAAANDIPLMGYFWMNEWPLSRYRDLWRRYESRMERVVYHEIYNADHVDLIARYPSCFRSKTHNFDDLIVSNIEVLFRKQPD